MELPEYKMNHQSRGMCLIFNQMEFDSIPRRGGSEIDAERARRTFESLGFSVTVYTDCTGDELCNTMENAAIQEDHTDADCFACVIMSHGARSEINGRDRSVPIDHLLSYFRGDLCQSLAGKPKLFFIQACQGKKKDPGVQLVGAGVESGESVGEGDGDDDLVTRIPAEADFFVAYATVQGYTAYRDREIGTWFINQLCEVLSERDPRLEIHHRLLKVNWLIAYYFETNAGMKQMPIMCSTLTKQLYF